MAEWKRVRLGEVADLLSGFPFDGHKYSPDGVRVVRGENVTKGKLRWSADKRWNEPFEKKAIYSLRLGDVVVSMDGNVGKNRTRILEEDLPLLLAQRVARLRAKVSVADQLFLYYCIFSQDFERYIDSIKTGTTISHISLGQLSEYEISLPPLSTQKKIAAVLGAIDDKIEANRKICANLEAQAQALFKSWFVDFEPFGGKMPEDWKEIKLSEIADFYGGYSYKGEELQSSNCALATIKNFERGGGFKLDGFKEIVPSPKLKPCHEVDIFDALVAHTDLTQKAEVIGNAEMLMSKAGYDKIIMSMDLVKVLPKKGVSKFLLGALLKNPVFKAHCLRYVNGTTVLHMSKSALDEYSLWFPDNGAVLNQVSELLENNCKKISAIIDESRALASMRDALLPRLMSGEIDVEKVEAA